MTIYLHKQSNTRYRTIKLLFEQRLFLFIDWFFYDDDDDLIDAFGNTILI